MADKDKNTRYELSALYRILHMYGMTDLANQCAGARSLENKDHSFVHPYGMFYEEITASSFQKAKKRPKNFFVANLATHVRIMRRIATSLINF